MYHSERVDMPAITPEDREQQLIAKAERLAEAKLDDGTAGPQIICHYLKLGSKKAELEQQLLEAQGSDIDGVSGASLTTNAFKQCMDDLFTE